MAKSIPAKEFKAAVKSLNVVLAEKEEDKIKIVGVKKDAVIEDFTNVVLSFIDNDDAESLPDEVIEVYNTYIAADEEEEEKSTPSKKTGAKKTGAKKTGAKKTGSSNEQTAYDMVKAGKSDKEITAKFAAIYKAKGKTDKDFIQKRADIYIGIAKRKIKAEGK